MTGPETDQPVGDTAEWNRYFDQLEVAMHDFEAALAQRDVTPLPDIPLPFGAPPEALKDRWATNYARLGELEFRALALREDLRAEFSRLHGQRRPGGAGSYGSSIDISG